MDVRGSDFRSHLPSILTAISRAHFVSFDLELSGIPVRQRGQSKAPGLAGKQTLQERYEDTKKAAEQYQVLQLGLTCVEEDRERGKMNHLASGLLKLTYKEVYILRPYNFFLNPVLEKKLEVERNFTFQSSAVEFLLGVGFRVDGPFREGVPYLSREEEARARAVAAHKRDKNNYEDIYVKVGDTEAFEFIDRVRNEVKQWQNQGMPAGFFNVTPIDNSRGLNGFQKRLVHQLIRTEFPDIVSLSKMDFIQLLPFDQRREDAVAQRKDLWFEQNLARQTGLRWVAEALCPGVDEVLPSGLRSPRTSGDLNAIRGWNQAPRTMADGERAAHGSRFEELLTELRTKLTVIVGHNVFIDLIYFYSCFFGPLPDRVEDFQCLMKNLFPMVFDTKYLADKINDNSPFYNSSLEGLNQELSRLPFPVVEVPPEHSKYEFHSPVHEAGFDSFLTAKVLIRLAARVASEMYCNSSPPSEDETFFMAPEQNSTISRSHQIDRPVGELYGRREAVQTTFSHSNPYAALQESDVKDLQYLQINQADSPDSVPASPTPTYKMMPHGDSSFWQMYGNKLRVNGTIEEVCEIP
ncbi:hypothetical protein ACLMJK_004929 [Lecanora helva]